MERSRKANPHPRLPHKACGGQGVHPSLKQQSEPGLSDSVPKVADSEPVEPNPRHSCRDQGKKVRPPQHRDGDEESDDEDVDEFQVPSYGGAPVDSGPPYTSQDGGEFVAYGPTGVTTRRAVLLQGSEPTFVPPLVRTDLPRPSYYL